MIRTTGQLRRDPRTCSDTAQVRLSQRRCRPSLRASSHRVPSSTGDAETAAFVAPAARQNDDSYRQRRRWLRLGARELLLCRELAALAGIRKQSQHVRRSTRLGKPSLGTERAGPRVRARPAGRHRRGTRRLPNADRSPSQSCDHVLAHRYSASASEARARPLTAGLTTARPARSRSEPLPIRPHRRSAAGRYSGQGPDGPRPCGPDVQPGRGRRNATGTSKVIATRGGDHLSSYGGPGVKG